MLIEYYTENSVYVVEVVDDLPTRYMRLPVPEQVFCAPELRNCQDSPNMRDNVWKDLETSLGNDSVSLNGDGTLTIRYVGSKYGLWTSQVQDIKYGGDYYRSVMG